MEDFKLAATEGRIGGKGPRKSPFKTILIIHSYLSRIEMPHCKSDVRRFLRAEVALESVQSRSANNVSRFPFAGPPCGTPPGPDTWRSCGTCCTRARPSTRGATSRRGTTTGRRSTSPSRTATFPSSCTSLNRHYVYELILGYSTLGLVGDNPIKYFLSGRPQLWSKYVGCLI